MRLRQEAEEWWMWVQRVRRRGERGRGEEEERSERRSGRSERKMSERDSGWHKQQRRSASTILAAAVDADPNAEMLHWTNRVAALEVKEELVSSGIQS